MPKGSKKGLTGLKFYETVKQFRELTKGLVPGQESPICQKCGLNGAGAKNPYIVSSGALAPHISFILDAPTRKEDASGKLGEDGTSLFMTKIVNDICKKNGIKDLSFRFVPLTRCAVIPPNKGSAKTGGKWCRIHAMEDLKEHRPRLIVPIGSTALGLLNYKSNAQDWGGKILTYRGWPDDWLTDSKFDSGHPLYGNRPTVGDHIPLFPVQAPRIIYGTTNPRVIQRWRNQVQNAIQLALSGVTAKVYDRSWWRITSDPNEVAEALLELIEHPGTVVTYDTETTGLRPFDSSKIVFMMIRWISPVTGKVKALGWPWDYSSKDAPAGSQVQFSESPMIPYIKELSPIVLNALSRSRLRGHNLTFDLQFTIATIDGGLAYLDALCNAFLEDTWHMRYTLRQERGSIGLELVAYDWAPDFAGYEEEFALLIERYPELLHPEKGGHYANCPPQFWESNFRPYVMGDVEVCAVAAENLDLKLKEAQTYAIPLAHPDKPGQFRRFTPPGRDFVYRKILSPVAGMLAKLMSRGMFIDPKELSDQETFYPKLIFDAKQKFRDQNPALGQWCDIQERLDAEWEFDLGKPAIIKEALYKVMDLPVVSLTDAGAKMFKSLTGVPKEELIKFASTDKYTINSLAANHPQIRPLLDYRTLMKQYTSYVRPLRNINTPGIDKKPRDKPQILMRDGMVHSHFNLCGTRGGRLSSSNPNLQQIPRDGMIKKQFASRFGERGCIYQADLSQIELRLLAAACGDLTMLKAYREGIDLHSLTTAKVFKTPYEHFTEEYEVWLQNNNKSDEAKKLKGIRKIGKTLNFLTGYGGGAYGFQSALALQGIYIPIEECEAHLNAFFDTYPLLKIHIGYYKKFILDHGLAVSITGRVRILEEIYSEDRGYVAKALRAGYNHLIQSSAADLLLLCLVAIEQLMRDEGLESIAITTVHDSLAIDAIKSEIPKIHEIVYSVIENIPEVLSLMLPGFDISWITVPLSGSYEVGRNLAETKTIPKENPDFDKILHVAFSA